MGKALVTIGSPSKGSKLAEFLPFLSHFHVTEIDQLGNTKNSFEILKEIECIQKSTPIVSIVTFGRGSVNSGLENIAQAVEQFKEKYSLSTNKWIAPSQEFINVFNNKKNTHEIFQSTGLQTPRTIFCKNSTDSIELSFPRVIKTTSETGGIGVKVTNNEEEYRTIFRKLSARSPQGLLVSEFIQGIEITYTIIKLGELLIPLPTSIKEETKIPIKHSDEKVKIAYNGFYTPQILEEITVLLKPYKENFICSFQAIFRENKAYFTEVTPRISGSFPIIQGSLKGFSVYKLFADFIKGEDLSHGYPFEPSIQYISQKPINALTKKKIEHLPFVLELKRENLSELPYSEQYEKRIRISYNEYPSKLDNSTLLASFLKDKEFLTNIEKFRREVSSFEPLKESIIASGEWSKNTSWVFLPTTTLPEMSLCTAVFGICINSKNEILLTENQRGIELPGGHIEAGENIEQALMREVYEETGAKVIHYCLIGVRKISSKLPDPTKTYPFPHSYIPHYVCLVDNALSPVTGSEIIDMHKLPLNEVRFYKPLSTHLQKIIKYASNFVTIKS